MNAVFISLLLLEIFTAMFGASRDFTALPARAGDSLTGGFSGPRFRCCLIAGFRVP
jgi:hypothetical protein